MVSLDIRNRSTRDKVTKFSIIMGIASIIGSALWLLRLLPDYNGTVFTITLITTGIAVITALTLYLYPVDEWDHNNASS